MCHDWDAKEKKQDYFNCNVFTHHGGICYAAFNLSRFLKLCFINFHESRILFLILSNIIA